MNNQKPLSRRKRSKITNYYHRYKTLKNYDQIVRLVLYKRGRTLNAGIYNTEDLEKPDVCLKSWDSRVLLKDFEPKKIPYSIGIQREINFGKRIAKTVNLLLEEDQRFNLVVNKKRLVLDLGDRKRRRFEPFVVGFNLESKIKIKHQTDMKKYETLL